MTESNFSNQQKGQSGQSNQPPQSVKQDGQENENRKSKVRRRWIILIVAAVIVIAGLIFGIPYYLYAVSHESTDDAFVDAHVSPVAARVAGHVWKIYVNDNDLVKQGDLLIELDPRDLRSIEARSRAKLEEAAALVKFAKITVTLTEITAYAALDEAKAAVRVAQADVESAKAGVAVAESQLKQGRADLVVARKLQQQAQTQVNAAIPVALRDQNDLKRYRQMYDSNAVTPQQLDYARAAAEVSAANLDDARKHAQVTKAQTALADTAVKTAQENVGRAEAALSQAHANLHKAQAQLASARSAPQKVAAAKSQLTMYESQVAQAQQELVKARLDLSYTKIYAPVAGRVSHKSAQLGSYVVPGQALMSIVPQDVFITANYKETALTHMEPGQPVSISIDAYPGVKFKGFVDSIQAGSGAVFSLLPPENATGNYIKVVQRIPVKIVFDPAPDQNEYYVVPGMSVIPNVDVSYRRSRSSEPQTMPPYTAWRAPFDSNSTNESGQPADSNTTGKSY